MEDRKQFWKDCEQSQKDMQQSRQELRAILANPASTPEQVIQVKLILARRIMGGPQRVRQICEKFDLTAEQSAKIILEHDFRSGERRVWAEQEAHRLEQLLAQMLPVSEPTQPAT